MHELLKALADSPLKSGGEIPQSGEEEGEKLDGAAFHFIQNEPSPIPVLIAAPHGGRAYPSEVTGQMRDPDFAQLRLEDRYVDLIAHAAAKATGGALLIAAAPRAMIDLNRAATDVDWGMIQRAAFDDRPQDTSKRARSGLGLIPRRLPNLGEIWRGHISHAALSERIEGIHAPYHAQLSAMLEGLSKRWGAALLVDLHSMPPLSPARFGNPAPKFVVGDRFGASAARSLSAAALEYFEGAGESAINNRPYAGGYVLDRHAAPARNIHALQVEICRSTYLSEDGADLRGSANEIAALVAGLVRKLAAETAALAPASGLSQAAE